jgi:nicotinamide-nucleotide amidase
VSMPGVPYEMRRMWEPEVEPLLEKASGSEIDTRTLTTLGLGESRVEELVSDLMRSTDPTLAPYAKADGVHLRITAKAHDSSAAYEKIDGMEARIRERLGEAVYGADGDTPHSVAASQLAQYGRAFIVVEIGPFAAGALGLHLVAHPFSAGVVSVRHPEQLVGFFHMPGLVDSASDVARGVSSLQVPVVIVVWVKDEPVGDDSSVNFDTEVAISLGGPSGASAHSRSRWRSAATEVARLSGLAAVNLLRKELRAALLMTEGSIA